MGILDWFKNRSAQFDPDDLSEGMLLQTIERIVALTNPRLKLLDSYQARMAPAVRATIQYFRDSVRSFAPAMPLSSANWAFNPALRAFFVAADDISETLGRSSNLKTFLDKFPKLDDAYIILGMKYDVQDVLGVAMQGEIVRQDVSRKVACFSDHQVRICGNTEPEVRRLLGAQGIEYLVAQALSEIGGEQSERQGLQDMCMLIRARLRMLQQHGPGFGSVFAGAPEKIGEQAKLEAQLLENERQLEALKNHEEALAYELATLCRVLEQPGQYLKVERQQLRLDSMNTILDGSCQDVVSEIEFSLATLAGANTNSRAFVLAHIERSDVPEIRMNLTDAERYL